MSFKKSKRQLNIHVSLGALNLVLYPDRANSTATSDPSGRAPAGAAIAQSNSLTSPSRVSDFAFSHVVPPNFDIGSPKDTFIYGLLNSNSGFDLLSEPAPNTSTFFPFEQRYGVNLQTTSSNYQYNFNDNLIFSTQKSSPFIPSRSSLTNESVPKLKTFNFWAIKNNGSFDDSVTYYNGNNPTFPGSWSNGTIQQVLDNFGQAAINIDARNNKTVEIERMFALQKDTLYNKEASIVFPTNTRIKPEKFNVDENGLLIIDPTVNCSWNISLDIKDISGALTNDSNFRGVSIQWGDLDTYKTSSLNTNEIVYYNLKLSTSSAPILEFYNSRDKDINQINIVGPTLSIGNRVEIYCWYVGNVMIIGFDPDPVDANVIGPIEPSSTTGVEFTTLYHKIPGGENNPKINSSISLTVSNMLVDFKYSALAFNNLVNKDGSADISWKSDDASSFKLQKGNAFSFNLATFKKISTTSGYNDLNNFFYGMGLIKAQEENKFGTPEYYKKIASVYDSPACIIDENTKINESSQFWSCDNRLISPYSSNYNNSNMWPLKIRINNPNYDSIDISDAVTNYNGDVSFVFTNPVYGSAYHGFTMSLFNASNISSSTNSNNISSVSTTSFSSSSTPLLIAPGNSYTDENRGLVVTPVFDFSWGNITDLVQANTISVSHTVENDSVGKSTCNFTMEHLINSTRGVNILNLLENNQFVVTIRAGYSNDINSLPIFFQGIITNVSTTRSPMGSTTNVTCRDWLNHVIENSYTLSTMALQGIRVRDRLNIALRLSGLSRYSEIINSEGTFLPETEQAAAEANIFSKKDIKFIQALNYRQGSATSKVAAQKLSETIDSDQALNKIITESIQFVVDDSALAIIYGNLRTENITDSNFDFKDISPQTPRRKIVIENRFLPTASTEVTHTRFRDELKWLVSPTNIDSEAITDSAWGQIDQSSFKDLSISQLHGCIVSPINFTSNVNGLLEGVYILAVGVGSVPFFHVRSSDSYFLGLGDNVVDKDFYLYATANNRRIGIVGLAESNVLDFIDRLDINSDTNLLQRATPINNRFDFGYVGFRKRYIDDLKQTYIQTKSDLIRRGDLWAQYIRKVPQSISFEVIVTKPLEHYNNFIIKHMDSIVNHGTNTISGTYPEIFDEFTGFLYKRVTYSIDKNNNMIKASVEGSPVPRINPDVINP